MEIIFIIICIIIIKVYKPAVVTQSPIVDLPMGKNKEGYFDETAFTEVYRSLRG